MKRYSYFNNPLLQLILAVLFIRLISLGLYPLMDPTEARYSEMARIMVETGNWITPQFDYGIPFWGKPPLQNWISALGILLFGKNEFAVRFPHWLAGTLTIIFIGLFAKSLKINPYLTILITICCPIFAINCGSVMTDMLLTMSITISMIGFYKGFQGSYIWGYIAFLGLGIGLLAKGPLIIILSMFTIGFWLILQYGFKGAFIEFWRRFPIISGSALMLLCAAPWYVAAEYYTPGFLKYFLIEEHFYRFLKSGWDGDLYGIARETPRGAIWLFFLLGSFPWSLLLLQLIWKYKSYSLIQKNNSPWVSFLAFWILTPPLFFTLSGNIQLSYILPSMPALGLLLAYFIQKNKYSYKVLLLCGMVTPALLIASTIAFNTSLADEYTDKNLIAAIDTTQNYPLYYLNDRSFSSRFYTSGNSILVTNFNQLKKITTPFYLIGEEESFTPNIFTSFNCEIKNIKSSRFLYLCHSKML